MSDKELLEMAAKAAGIGPVIGVTEEYLVIGPRAMQRFWQPLHNDSDALRLGVKLHLLSSPVFYHHLGLEKLKTSDEYAATRRAIVRAAAAIGEAME